MGPLLDPAHILDSSRRRVWGVTRAHLSGEPPASSELSGSLSPLATSEERPLSPASSAVQLRRPGPWGRVCLAGLSHIRPAPQNCAAQAALTPSVMRRATRLLRHARLCKGSTGLKVGTRARSCLALIYSHYRSVSYDESPMTSRLRLTSVLSWLALPPHLQPCFQLDRPQLIPDRTLQRRTLFSHAPGGQISNAAAEQHGCACLGSALAHQGSSPVSATYRQTDRPAQDGYRVVVGGLGWVRVGRRAARARSAEGCAPVAGGYSGPITVRFDARYGSSSARDAGSLRRAEVVITA